MSITLVYRSEEVAPICRKIAAQDDRFKVIHEDLLTPAMVKAPPAVRQLIPVDPLIALWDDAVDAAEAFIELPPTRQVVAIDGIGELRQKLHAVIMAAGIPAPIAPPPIQHAQEVLIRWGSRWYGEADITINSAEAVAIARDKRESRRVLTGICPKTWIRQGEVILPAVVRPRRHHAGSRFCVVRTRGELERAINRCGPGWYASALIEKAHEYRVFVLQGRVVCVSERFPAAPGEIAWNLAAGGKLINVKRKSWPIDACKAAIDAAKRVGLDWSAVDVYTDNQGKAGVFEVNTAPGLKNHYTIEQVAWALARVAEYINHPQLDLTSTGITWENLIHPSLNGRADTTDGQ